ncbi:MAG: hypothetical protein Fur0036_19750 [Fimbriimonadaceae bacterium]
MTALLIGLATVPAWNENPVGVTVQWPQPPQARELALGTSFSQRYAYELVLGAAVYRVDLMELKDSAMANRTDLQLLDTGMKGTETLKQFRPLRVTPTRVDGLQARRWDVQVDKGPLMRHLLVVKRPWLIHALYIGDKQDADTKATNDFFGSLKINTPQR